MSSAALFKKFTLQNVAQIAHSSHKEQAQVRRALADQFPALADFWDEILPPRADVMLVRCHDHVQCVALVAARPEVLFFSHHGGRFVPHLRLLQRFPFALPRHRVDIGACRYVISGADVMCPGLTSAGGEIGEGIAAGELVGIYVEGKEHAVAVGRTLMDAEEIERVNKGHCIENIHYLGDGLWMNRILSDSHIGGL